MSTAWRLDLLCFAASQVKTQQDFSGTPGGGVRQSDFKAERFPSCSNHESVDVQSLQGFEGRKRDFEGCLWEFSQSSIKNLDFQQLLKIQLAGSIRGETSCLGTIGGSSESNSKPRSQSNTLEAVFKQIEMWRVEPESLRLQAIFTAKISASRWRGITSSSYWEALDRSCAILPGPELSQLYGCSLLRCRWCIYGQTIQHEAKTRSNKSIIATQTTSYHSFIWIQHMIR